MLVDFFVYKLASFGFDHNFDHNAGDFIWSIAGASGLFWTQHHLLRYASQR